MWMHEFSVNFLWKSKIYSHCINEVINTFGNVNLRQNIIFENSPQPLDLKVSPKLSERKVSDYFTRILFIKGSHLCKFYLDM